MLVLKTATIWHEGVDAEYNWQVVEKLVNLIRAMGLEPATPDEARQMLNLRKR